MRLFQVDVLLTASNSLERLRMIITSREWPETTSIPIGDEMTTGVREELECLRRIIEPLELPFTLKDINRWDTILGQDDPPEVRLTLGQVASIITEIQNRLKDELGATIILQIPSHRAAYFSPNDPFGAEVGARFPVAVIDLEEACSCFALARYTACAFHLMRALEIGLHALSQDLGVTLPPTKNWQEFLDRCRGALSRLPHSTVAEKAYLGERSASLAHLQAVKDAWRNDTMHPRASYTEQQASSIIQNARELMQSLAKYL